MLEEKKDNLVRIEIRFLRKEVPIKHYADYIQMGEMDMFKILHFNYLTLDKINRSNLKGSQKEKLIKYYELASSNDANYARSEMNRGKRNFHSTTGKYLKQVAEQLDLGGTWSRKVKKRIVGDFDIYDFFNISK